MQTVEMRIGERRQIRRGGQRVRWYKTDRFFVFYVSATGHEGGLKECPLLRQRFMKALGGDDNGGWLSEYIYDADNLVSLKAVSLGTETHKDKRNSALFITLDDQGPKYQITAPTRDEEVGRLIFRGKIDYKRSGLTKAQVAEYFKVELLSSQKAKAKGPSGRNILFRKGKK